MTGDFMRTSIARKAGGAASGIENNDADREVYLFNLRILGYAPDDIKTQPFPDCILRSLDEKGLLPYGDTDGYPLAVINRYEPHVSLRQLGGALQALRENHFGYMVDVLLFDKSELVIQDNLQAWLSPPNSTPKLYGKDKSMCKLTANLIEGVIVDELPFDPNDLASWLLEAHMAFTRDRDKSSLQDLDRFLGGV